MPVRVRRASTTTAGQARRDARLTRTAGGRRSVTNDTHRCSSPASRRSRATESRRADRPRRGRLRRHRLCSGSNRWRSPTRAWRTHPAARPRSWSRIVHAMQTRPGSAAGSLRLRVSSRRPRVAASQIAPRSALRRHRDEGLTPSRWKTGARAQFLRHPAQRSARFPGAAAPAEFLHRPGNTRGEVVGESARSVTPTLELDARASSSSSAPPRRFGSEAVVRRWIAEAAKRARHRGGGSRCSELPGLSACAQCGARVAARRGVPAPASDEVETSRRPGMASTGDRLRRRLRRCTRSCGSRPRPASRARRLDGDRRLRQSAVAARSRSRASRALRRCRLCRDGAGPAATLASPRSAERRRPSGCDHRLNRGGRRADRR